MSTRRTVYTFLAVVIAVAVQTNARRAGAQAIISNVAVDFPPELVEWSPAVANPVFVAGGPHAWDAKMRERGWILRDKDGYRLWYTGYDGTREGIKRLGYATSPDGLHWTRWPNNPLVNDHWIEDMMVVEHGGTYYMFAEGAAAGHAELFTSQNGIRWQWRGPLDIRLANGVRPARKPCGTPTVWIENGVWYLFYEWHDRGVWLARSQDPMSRVWIHVTDEPVLVPGPADYDRDMVAMNQVIKHRGTYYAFYHGSGSAVPRTWNTNIARSRDLVHWQKFAGNPIVADNKSSGIVMTYSHGLRLYTMHEQVDVFYSHAALSRSQLRDRERAACREPYRVPCRAPSHTPCRARLLHRLRLRCGCAFVNSAYGVLPAL
jgi:hypothetical protein